MSAKFIYYRYLEECKKNPRRPEQPPSYKVSCKGGIAVGYIWDERNQKIKLAVARCAPEDHFNKRVARDIVLGRLESKKPHRNTEIDLKGVIVKTPHQAEDIVWGWLEEKERLWDAEIQSHTIH